MPLFFRTLSQRLPNYISYQSYKRALAKTNDPKIKEEIERKIKHIREEMFLHFASTGNINKLKSKLKHNINIFVTDKDGNTALHLAVLNRQLKMILTLRELGLSPRTENFKKETPDSIALENNWSSVIAYLEDDLPEIMEPSSRGKDIDLNSDLDSDSYSNTNNEKQKLTKNEIPGLILNSRP